MKKRRWLKRLLIGLAIPLGLVIVVIILVIIGTKGSILTGGVPLEKVAFTSGNLADFPAYPESEQLTGTQDISVPDDMRRVVGDGGEWKLYMTADSEDAVLSWYDANLDGSVFNKGIPRESKVVLYSKGEVRYTIFVLSKDGKAYIIIGKSKG